MIILLYSCIGKEREKLFIRMFDIASEECGKEPTKIITIY
jgi:hypothetical protein